jgi:hypothetical protein
MDQSNTVLPTTLAVPIFGKIAYGMGENTSYAAASRGDFPTIKIGGKVRVPLRLALAKIAGGDHETLKAMTADFAAKLNQIMAEQAA